MNKTCARCEKTVYPTEELKCLDKVWHKGCFKCQGCAMTLNMRTYKGFNKQPYCEAHIPKAKATTMAETPELKRIAENTKIQSNVKYHADFEKSKGKFTQVADDPETLRIKQNSKIISNVAYHGDLEKKAAMEQKRTLNENGEYVDVPDDNTVNANHKGASAAPTSSYPPPPSSNPSYNSTAPSVAPASAIGKISDYDPLNDQPRNSPYSSRQNQTLIYTSDRGAVTAPPSRKIGSIADIDPINNVYGDLIVNVTNIDGGWMTGTVKRSGETGMLPANYVEIAHI
ncbi:lasp [Carabus blaptoides fortunei]